MYSFYIFGNFWGPFNLLHFIELTQHLEQGDVLILRRKLNSYAG